MTPGLAGTGPQIFAEMEYSLLGEGFADLILDVGGEDPLVDASWGDVTEVMRSRGVCVGTCAPGALPIEINLGESWARLREQMYAPPMQPAPQPAPVNAVAVEPVVVDPVAEVPVVGDPTPAPVEPTELPQIDIDINPEIGWIEFPILEYPDHLIDFVGGIDIDATLPIWYFVGMPEGDGYWQHVQWQYAIEDGGLGTSVAYDGLILAQTVVFNELRSNAFVDAVAVRLAVPEPATGLLFIAASLGLTVRRRPFVR